MRSTTAASVAPEDGGAAEAAVTRRPAGVFGRVLGLSLVIAGLAAALYFLAVRNLATYGAPIAVSWLILRPGTRRPS